MSNEPPILCAPVAPALLARVEELRTRMEVARGWPVSRSEAVRFALDVGLRVELLARLDGLHEPSTPDPIEAPPAPPPRSP